MSKITSAGFISSLSSENPPADLSIHAKALWFAGKGDWNKAHDLIQDINDKQAAQIHAFLHRQEGDLSNASYWYAKAESHFPTLSLEEEWDSLVAFCFR
jgi:hypothetical protein